MGRMQKKKPESQKKAKKGAGDSAREDLEQNAGTGSSASGSKGGGTRTGSLEAGSRKQKSAASASRKSSGDQTFLMKLLERYFGNWIQFLREVRNELSKVVWPSRREATGMTGVVLVFVLIVSFFLGIIDFGLSSLVRIII